MNTLPAVFGTFVFNDEAMQKYMPADIYRTLKKTMQDGRHLDSSIADAVAHSMMDWAMEKGATHFTHWFQPLTGITAEKHDAFIEPDAGGKMLLAFSGKELIKGEPDASSLPSGGLRATFEARGYTAWDPNSYAFIKDGTLCIPTAFCSYGGEALDKKTPLLRSMEAVNRQAMRILKLFGSDATRVITTVGPEQEYFLIDKAMFDRRKDLQYTGRTLFGARPPKGQELDDHYFGSIKTRVSEYMKELDEELWKLGIYAKTEHNETAPAQHELAPVYTATNVATDHNQLTMEIMKKVAGRHGLVCLLHEKPFEGINGSGKHNNWSLSTNTGINLLEPGETPRDNAQFLLFLCAVIKAVDEYQDLLRISVASAGNDHRLGGNEAPPAVISMFLGDELSSILDSIESDSAYDAQEKTLMKIGVHTLPRFPRDNTDRNRTSPLAFTGNKFEFRMLGSSASIADVNVMLNTGVAESLRLFADELENADDFETALNTLIRRTVHDHKRIIFNGNGYDDAWKKEAQARGLLNLADTPACIPYLLHEKNIRLFETHRVLSEAEVRSRYEIMLTNYCMTLQIEAMTALEMTQRDILPAVMKYTQRLADSMQSKLAFGVPCTYEKELLRRLSECADSLYDCAGGLCEALEEEKKMEDGYGRSLFFRDCILPVMDAMRASADEAETLVAADCWPYPGYGDMIYSVRD